MKEIGGNKFDESYLSNLSKINVIVSENEHHMSTFY